MSNTTTTTATTNPTITFGTDADTGFYSSGDQITIVAGGVGANKQIDNYKKVHVARRRQAKKFSRPATWTISNMSPTVLTVTIDP